MPVEAAARESRFHQLAPSEKHCVLCATRAREDFSPARSTAPGRTTSAGWFAGRAIPTLAA